MGLMQDATKWVLFLASPEEPEERHVLDLAFGLHCLESAGVSSENIEIYIDGDNRQNIISWMSIGSNNPYEILPTEHFFNTHGANAHSNLVMFVTGHGGPNGIAGKQDITPYLLLTTLKTMPGLEKAIVYLGQCFAGVFNYIGAGSGRFKAAVETKEADVIFIGATNLHSSLSLSTKENVSSEDDPSKEFNWIANVFLYNVFKWFSKPIDIDGDGRITIIDSYKFAGSYSNIMNKDFRVNSFVASVDLHSVWKDAVKARDAENTPQNAMDLSMIEKRYVNILSNSHTHQECWILNAIPAQFIEV
ncbi:hypothetical protein [Klebsiella pneumoniae]|uniref:Uncharacterized protein n=1 Tax=Klebsiella pneumoniae TaxID=573 RepID=A0A483LDN7_KLEPN|nr:hypothetical protein [Klebsiella pneumoniae]HDT0144088.1 hypothetical protein [Klebsiella pneumoniae subsp. pneumoniae]MCP5622568.1 hypothetical protein [Klebsiella pneumoniae]MCP6081100.1 hypothetical protein [Klebsiella pneumoniae]MCP6263124.1 hypothetical protein [Klebsiella pneumoniae]MCP6339857.1 hypothetical protein [Klebsiella pneumoniae]